MGLGIFTEDQGNPFKVRELMTKSPTLSIITATYNSGSTLEKTLQTAINQTFQDFELIVIDGGSKDETLNIIEKYKDKISYWVSEKDKGIPDALNKGVIAAKGDWIYFLNSDDVFHDHEVLGKVFRTKEIENVDFLYGNVIMKSGNYIYDKEFTPEKFLLKNICHQAQFFRREKYIHYGMLEIKYKYVSDWVFNIKTFTNSSIRWKYIDLIIADFNIGGKSSTNVDVQFWLDSEALFLQYLYPHVSRKEIYHAIYPKMDISLKRGNLLVGIQTLCKILLFTGSITYAKTAGSLIKKRYF
jgi:glycosyltransferase involved in cell wall biosynthesis